MNKQVSITLKVISALLLFLALGAHPYSYYVFLRWGIFISSAYLAYEFYEFKDEIFPWVFAVIAILFNPIFPIFLARDTWQIIDFVVGVIFLFSLSKDISKNANN